MTRRYRNHTGYPLAVPGLPEPLPPNGEIDENKISLQHDPKLGGSITGLTLIEPEPEPEPAKPGRKTTDQDKDKEVAAR
jgi:hypothetical protein